MSANQAQQDVDFLLKPEVVGLQQYYVSVSRKEGEITYRNNGKSVFINVQETRVKIALFAGATHPDIGALRQSLEKDDRYEIVEFIHKDRTAYFESPDNYNFEDFDLVQPDPIHEPCPFHADRTDRESIANQVVSSREQTEI